MLIGQQRHDAVPTRHVCSAVQVHSCHREGQSGRRTPKCLCSRQHYKVCPVVQTIITSTLGSRARDPVSAPLLSGVHDECLPVHTSRVLHAGLAAPLATPYYFCSAGMGHKPASSRLHRLGALTAFGRVDLISDQTLSQGDSLPQRPILPKRHSYLQTSVIRRTPCSKTASS